MTEVRAAEEALAQQFSPQAIGQMGMGKVMHGKVVNLAARLPHIWTDLAATDVICAPMRACRPASTSAPRAWTPPWRMPS